MLLLYDSHHCRTIKHIDLSVINFLQREQQGYVNSICLVLSVPQQSEEGQGPPSVCRHRIELKGVAWIVLQMITPDLTPAIFLAS